MNDIIESLTQELKRGTIVLSVLSRLNKEKYGYSLIKELKEFGFEVDQSTLYPLLRRLEKKNILESVWNVEEKRPRKYYKITSKGQQVYEKLAKEYYNMHNSIIKMVGVKDETN